MSICTLSTTTELRADEQEAPASSAKMTTGAWLLLFAFTTSLFLFGLGSARTFTGHEGHFAAIVQEMLATGDCLVPKIGGGPWLEKPPLPHWCMVVSCWLCGGVSEFACRLPAALAGVAGVCLIASLAARWFGPTHGLLTGLIQATTYTTVTYSRLAESDPFLWLLTVLCFWLFCRCHVLPVAETQRRSGALSFYVVLGLTNLAKGPLFGMAVVLVPCLGFVLLSEGWRGLRWFVHVPGIVLMLLIGASWPLAILLQHPEAWHLWLQHTLGRIGPDAFLNAKPFWYYLTTFPWQTLPWCLVAWLAFRESLRSAWHKPKGPDRFLWLWFLLPLVVLSIPGGKHHHYLLHALPPFSFWAATGLLKLRVLPEWAAGRRLPLAGFSLLAAAVAAAGVLITVSQKPELMMGSVVLGAAFTLGVTGIGWANYAMKVRLGVAGLFVLIWILMASIHTQIMPHTDTYGPETAFLRKVEVLTAEGRPIVVYAVEPSRILLYADESALRYLDVESLREKLAQQPEALIITSVWHAEHDLNQLGDVRLVTDTAISRGRRGPKSLLAAYEMRQP